MDQVTQLAKEVETLKREATLQNFKLTTLEKLSHDNLEGQAKLINEMHELTTGIRLLVEKQQSSKESADRMWKEHDALNARVGVIETAQKVNQPVIDGIRSINSKLILVIITAMLATVVAPAATVTMILDNISKRQVQNEQRQAERHQEQQSREH